MKWLILILMLLVLGCTSRKEHEDALNEIFIDDAVIYKAYGESWTYVVCDTSGTPVMVIRCNGQGSRKMYMLKQLNKGVTNEER